jgi:hypothetical protein
MRHKFSTIAALMLVFAVQGFTQIPRTMSYQGVLTDTLGNPKPDGSWKFTFRLYISATGGPPIWVDQKALQVKRGLFTTILGDQTPFGPGLAFDRPYWLGISVADDEELAPRIPMTSSAYSLNSAKADTASYARISPHGAVTDSARIAGTVGDGGITTAKLQDKAVTRGKLADTVVTGDKISLPLSLNADCTGLAVLNILNDNDYRKTGTGIMVHTNSGYAILASSEHGKAIGCSNNSGTYADVGGSDDAFIGYSGTGGRAGYFLGRVEVTGTLTKGGGAFKIDHPLDPENLYLYHSFVESPDMKNIYDGIVVLDAKGSATVHLPDYFEALNGDYRYQLTCMGGYSPVYISQEISGNIFRIDGGTHGLKVSWQVTGIRRDPFARAHRIIPEVEKNPNEKGTYIHPREYGVNPQKGRDYTATQQGLENQRLVNANRQRTPANRPPGQ